MKNYNASSISVYKGLDAVRKRPGMYIGDVDDVSGLNRMIFEVVDNSIDEVLAGYCNIIRITLNKENYVTISDNGRGMPVDIYENDRSAVEIIMTVLHAGAKFNEKVYHVSGGLHGVGVSVVNALSKELNVKIFRSGLIYEQNYIFGKPVDKLKIIGHTSIRGTEISFSPDFSIFKKNEFDYSKLLFRFKELSYLNSGLKFELIDKRYNKFNCKFINNKGGIKSFVEHLNKKKITINKDILYFNGNVSNIEVSVAIQWIDVLKDNIFCYTNNIYQKDGGSHLIGFKSILTKVFKNYIEDQVLKSNYTYIIQGDDIREGIVCILSLYMSNPKFSSQIKDKLVSNEARRAVEIILFPQIRDFLYENPCIAKIIANKIVSSAKARYAAKKARDLVKKKDTLDYNNALICVKLADCQEKRPELSEIFLVEGDSAGGSAKQARDRKTQAVLPLKGKILNVERATFDKVLSSSEIASLVSALKCGVASKDYDETKLRYHKIIFMTDADVDGSHIRTLLLTFFLRQMPGLIKNGHVFISRPPLYRLIKKNETFYIKDKSSFNNFLFDSVSVELEKIFNANQLKETLILYKKVFSKIEVLSHKYPKIFFEKLLYFENGNFILKKNFSLYINHLQSFLNQHIDKNQQFFLKIDLSYERILKILFVKYGVLKEYKLDLKFFLSNDFNIILECQKSLKLLFCKKKIDLKNNLYNFYNFDNLINVTINKIISKYNIQRYKGLGEMNPQQLWDTTMNPVNRNLQVLKINNINTMNNILLNLMGGNIDERKRLIEEKAYSFSNLDI